MDTSQRFRHRHDSEHDGLTLGTIASARNGFKAFRNDYPPLRGSCSNLLHEGLQCLYRSLLRSAIRAKKLSRCVVWAADNYASII
jgi:hypothetical protein